MSEAELGILFLKITAYIVAVSSGLLLLFPNPEKAKEILILKAIPLWYARFYNVLRFFSTNRGWVDRKNGNGERKP